MKNASRSVAAALVLQLAMLTGSGQTTQYFYTGSLANVTLAPGTYNILAFGARGGSAAGPGGGMGAEMGGTFTFLAPTTLTLLVASQGQISPQGAGGGGGSFFNTVPSVGGWGFGGGGGSGGGSFAGGGGGGGYSGGGGGGTGGGSGNLFYGGSGGGGGSFLDPSATDIIAFSGVHSGNGEIDITLVPEPTLLSLFAVGMLLAMFRSRQNDRLRP